MFGRSRALDVPASSPNNSVPPAVTPPPSPASYGKLSKPSNAGQRAFIKIVKNIRDYNQEHVQLTIFHHARITNGSLNVLMNIVRRASEMLPVKIVLINSDKNSNHDIGKAIGTIERDQQSSMNAFPPHIVVEAPDVDKLQIQEAIFKLAPNSAIASFMPLAQDLENSSFESMLDIMPVYRDFSVNERPLGSIGLGIVRILNQAAADMIQYPRDLILYAEVASTQDGQSEELIDFLALRNERMPRVRDDLYKSVLQNIADSFIELALENSISLPTSGVQDPWTIIRDALNYHKKESLLGMWTVGRFDDFLESRTGKLLSREQCLRSIVDFAEFVLAPNLSGDLSNSVATFEHLYVTSHDQVSQSDYKLNLIDISKEFDRNGGMSGVYAGGQRVISIVDADLNDFGAVKGIRGHISSQSSIDHMAVVVQVPTEEQVHGRKKPENSLLDALNGKIGAKEDSIRELCNDVGSMLFFEDDSVVHEQKEYSA